MSAMAVAVASLTVGVAAVPVEPTPMRKSGRDEKSRQNNGKQCFHW
jgi:hypothetical protein